MRKILSIVIFFLLMSAVSFCAAHEEPEITINSSGDWDYIENEKGITLIAYRGNAEELDIPSELDGQTVTYLQKDLFANNLGLLSVTIPDTVTGMGTGLFYGCSALERIHLSKMMRAIPENAFRYCSSLKTVETSVLLTEIGNTAFADCTSLESLDLPSVTKIGRGSFSNCYSLSEISLLSVSTIDKNAFVNCISLQELTLYNVTSISDYAFDNCIQLASITLTQKLSTVGSNAFRDTAWLNSQTDDFVILGQGILIRYNGTEKDVQIPSGVKRIVDAFKDNYMIESVTIPETVLQIDANAFRDAVNLRTIQLPPYLSSIGPNAFDGCRCITEITLPSTVKRVDSSAFANCSLLQRFEFPAVVTDVASKVLSECPNLTDVTIPASVVRIGPDSFSGSPNVVLHLAHGSFAETFAQEQELPYDYTVQENMDFVYFCDEDGAHIIRYVGSLYDVEIPAQLGGFMVVSIEAGAFQNSDHVHRIIVPLTVKSIGDWAFSEMDRLEAVQFSIGIEHLGANLFTGTNGLKEIKFPGGIRSIGPNLLDSESETRICAADGSQTAAALTSLGYSFLPESSCSEDAELMALWSELYELEDPTPQSCVCDVPPEVPVDESYAIIRIPDGVIALTADMLAEAGNRLQLIIPASVTAIDAEILENHEILAIVSSSGSAAEFFAREHGIRFLVEFIYNL